ncbi:MAG TPA: bifunctional UDP-3-O-[3-hydroxymyristoyl] N-acetylglucosamine deacetylase/3-hydroxyacyl-ACP dehydratase [Gemmatimonadales bacterium]|nr:bifunctional UDP-3-O-[3-hydroxymyristoyl] N-acetylglucosamine deacetylase/3-hydroxyacyl-ACP dehydratase [Gemmatimonadales bacterium]
MTVPRSANAARRTVRRASSLEGVGMHTGASTRVTFLPGAPGDGVSFRRVDLAARPCIPAKLANVTAVERRTVIAADGAEVHTVEHLLAAVMALRLDDLVVEISGPEPPIMDGSFRPFLEALQQAEPVEHGGEATELVVRDAFTVTEGDSSYLVGPDPGLRLTTTIEFPHPLIGRQWGSFEITTENFAAELAPARTFGFVREVEALKAKGLISGGTVENAIVLDEKGLISGSLRWSDEFVRHKTADVLGDLALVGARVRAHVVSTRPSHKGNVALGRAIQQRAARSGAPVMDVRQIVDVIPHRYPFLLVDRIIEADPGSRRIVGIKNVTINEPFFQGHFPGHPVMPGVLVIEAMAQCGGMLLMSAIPVEDHHKKVVYFMSLDSVKFRRPVVPGDQLRLELEMLKFGGRTCRMRGRALVEGNVCCEAEMMAAIVDK